MTELDIVRQVQADTGILVRISQEQFDFLASSGRRERKRREVHFSGLCCLALKAAGFGDYQQIRYAGDNSYDGVSTDKIVRRMGTAAQRSVDIIGGGGGPNPIPIFLPEQYMISLSDMREPRTYPDLPGGSGPTDPPPPPETGDALTATEVAQVRTLLRLWREGPR